MKKITLFLTILIALISVNVALGEFGPRPGTGPQFYSEFRPVVGSWAEYKIARKGESPITMRIAVVGKEGESYWYETVLELQEGKKVISKMLVSGNPEDKNNLKRIIMKAENQPAMEMPVQMLPLSSQSMESKVETIEKGLEKITVPAGTFNTQHFQYKVSGSPVDSWINKEVPPYGLVRSKSDEYEMVLLKYGTGAKTQITEEPMKFEMPQMRQGLPKFPIPGKNADE